MKTDILRKENIGVGMSGEGRTKKATIVRGSVVSQMTDDAPPQHNMPNLFGKRDPIHKQLFSDHTSTP
ncbi:hypothetical protein TSUD_101580 [Trifolium subterraneum]|uniref:Uncharacterized protein n=1 Tax=Trifolium subterraneum TaxID=3900 RepID=A0A2Z6NRY7_TRISU|nr:hypothetical protein TSUD_101580 [Trifolium subterraneum]